MAGSARARKSNRYRVPQDLIAGKVNRARRGIPYGQGARERQSSPLGVEITGADAFSTRSRSTAR